jgi:hypothetical protein
VYDKYTTEEFRQHAFDVFDDRNGLLHLKENGWIVANHSAAHYPLSISLGERFIQDQFQECADACGDVISDATIVVLPFEYNFQDGVDAAYRKLLPDQLVVPVQNRPNTVSSYQAGFIYRYVVNAEGDPENTFPFSVQHTN